MYFILRISFLLVLPAIIISCRSESTVQVGLDQVDNYPDLFVHKQIGIITNHSAYNEKGRHITDIFYSMKQLRVTALFGPEHGIRGDESAGKEIENKTDPIENIPIYSLYGDTKKPTSEMLQNIDILVFDVQDIGSRYYTYISTMALAMEAAAEKKIPFLVLDRPNPINGLEVEGNLVESDFTSFIGLFPIPVRHGMTIAELACMINEEGWLKEGIKADLNWIPLNNWRRELWYDQTGLTWRPPSPNIPTLTTATVYPGTCLFEGTNISEGRGTYQPFQRIGAPWYKEEQFFMLNQILNLAGIHAGPISFSPISIPSMAAKPKFEEQKITGISIAVTDREVFEPYLAGIALVKYFYELNKEQFIWREEHFDRLCGTDKIRKFIIQGKNIEEIKVWIDKDEQLFRQKRKKYLLY